MASSNDSGTPVALSPPISIGSEWSSKTDAPKLAREMAAGPRLAPPSFTTAFASPNHARIYIMAYGLQNDFAALLRESRQGLNAGVKMCCSRSMGNWIDRVQGDCKFQVIVNFDGEGNVSSVSALLEHSHDFNIKARPKDFLPKNSIGSILPAVAGRVARSRQRRPYHVPNTSDESNDEFEAGRTRGGDETGTGGKAAGSTESSRDSRRSTEGRAPVGRTMQLGDDEPPSKKRRSQFGFRFADEEEEEGALKEDDFRGGDATVTPLLSESWESPAAPSAISSTPVPLPVANSAALPLSSLSRLLSGFKSTPPLSWTEQLAYLICTVHPRLLPSASICARLFDQAGITDVKQFVEFLSSLRKDSVDPQTATRIARIVGDGSGTGGMSQLAFELFVEGFGSFAAE